MRGLQVVQWGLFLILLGFSVILFADLVIAIGVVSLFSMFSSGGGGMESAVFGGKVIAWGLSCILLGTLLGGIGKFLCVGAPENGARNLIVVSVICDLALGSTHFAFVTGNLDWFASRVLIYLLSLTSYITFLKFLTRMGDNVGEPRVGRYVAIIYGGIGGGFLVPLLLLISWKLFLLSLCIIAFVSIFVYNYTIYTLFRALPLYMEEVKMGITDPTESGAERAEKERKERLKGPGEGGGPTPTKPPEEPKGPPPPGAKLYRIPKSLEPLHLAVKEGDRYKTEVRLSQGDDPNARVKHGLTPLHIAASSGVMDVADALIKGGAEVDATSEKGLTPLYFAIQTGNPNIVGFFLDKGANLYHRNEDGFTPLLWACCAPHPNFVGPIRVKMVELLISQGADLNAKNNEGKSARDLALENQLEDLIAALDRHLVTPTTGRSSFQQQSTDVSAQAGQPQPANFTPFQGIHLSTMPKELTDLHQAVKEGDPEKIQHQLAAEGDLNDAIEGGLKPIHITAITGVMSGSNLLLGLGADVNDTCDFNLTPLFLAVHVNNLNMVGYLISRGANPNHQDEMGRTPLHWAAAAPHEKLEGQNRVKMVEFLLQHGADPGVRDNEGKSARDLATAAEHDELLKLFESGDEGGEGGDDDSDYYL